MNISHHTKDQQIRAIAAKIERLKSKPETVKNLRRQCELLQKMQQLLA